MNRLCIVLFLLIISIRSVHGQSATLELKPTFHQRGNENISESYDIEMDAEDLDFVGLSCYHFGGDIEIFYRLEIRGKWSPWMKFQEQHEFVAADRRAYQGELLTDHFTKIQFRANQHIEQKITVRIFIAGKRDVPAEYTISARSSCELSEVCERACWCPECPVDSTPQLTEPTHLIVHHSAGTNVSNNFASLVEFIWDLHVKTNGWDDIGYNWLIDPNGKIYEGRPDDYQGAHFSCLNENTVGICVLGNYVDEPPSQEAITKLVEALAFEATQHEIDVLDESYHVKGDFFLENISGHRDSAGSDNACSSTVCPGDAFYPLLDSIRNEVSILPCYAELTDVKNEVMAKLKVFPNPTNQILYLESPLSEDLSFRLIDIHGRKVQEIFVGKANDISALTSGIYYLYGAGKIMEKVVKW